MKTQKKISTYPKFTYEKEDDILMVELTNKPIDYAEQTGDVIVHFSPSREAVLLEILDASKFLKAQSKVLPKEIREEAFLI